jgi:hypothetical protein
VTNASNRFRDGLRERNFGLLNFNSVPSHARSCISLRLGPGRG